MDQAVFFALLTAVTVAGWAYQRLMEQRGVEGPTKPAANRFVNAPSVIANLFQSIGENFPAAKNEQNPYRDRLSAAGYRWPSALPIFYGIKVGSALFFAGLMGIAALVYRGEPSLMPLPMICGLGVGFLLPDRVLTARIRARTQRLRSAIPAALDMMVLAMEAGQSLDQSVADTSRGLKHTHPDLSGELAQLFLELRTGSGRAESFRAMAAQQGTGTPEAVPPADRQRSLRRQHRAGPAFPRQVSAHSISPAAQERARKVGVKLIFPVFFLIFPSVLLVTLGPACMMMYQQLNSMLK